MVEQRHNKEIEVDLVDILYKIISIRKILYKAAGIGLLIGLIVAFSIPKQYTVRVTLSPEMGNSKGNSGLAGLASSFLGNGAIVGEGPDALNASLSSDIVSSTPFLLELFEINVPINDKGGKVTLKEYLDTQVSPWWVYILNIPNMIISGIKYLVVTEEEGNVDFMRFGVIELTEENRKLIEVLKKKIVATVDKKTMITNVSVTLQDPKVAAIVADSAVRKLQKSIIGYRTSKAKDDCAYLENLFKERQIEYYDTQKKYANYVDTHDNLILQSVRTEQERLQNDMSLAYQVYSQVANQLQVARAKVQEEKPVFAIVEPAVVPLQPSGIGKKVYILLFVFLAVAVTIVWMFIGKELLNRFREMK